MIHKCPTCHKKFRAYLNLKSKDDVVICDKHGLWNVHNGYLERTRYPCPKCKGNYKRPYYTRRPYSYCKCERHGKWRVSFVRSFNFRKTCSELARKPNRATYYFTPPEQKVKETLDKYRIGYLHNHRYFVRGRTFYPDFIIIDEKIENMILEVDPSVWHKRWARNDVQKIKIYNEEGFSFISLSDDCLSDDDNIDRAIKEILVEGIFDSVIPGGYVSRSVRSKDS
jgi:very-short-patch-repair endonuclease